MMKKIVSLLSAIAMIFTILTTVAFADENNYVFYRQVGDVVDNKVTYELVVQTNKNLDLIQVVTNITDAISSGATITGTAVNATAFTVNNTSKVISATFNSAIETKTGEFVLYTIVVDKSKQTRDFSFSKKAINAREIDSEGAKVTASSAFTSKLEDCSVTAPAATTEYTVTFKADDTEVSSVKVAENGTVAKLPDAPAKDGYTFSKWVANGAEFTTSTVITADTTVTAEYIKNEEEKYGTPITEGVYAGKTLYFNEEGATTFNFGTDKGIEITKTVGETVEKKIVGVKYLYDKGIEAEENKDNPEYSPTVNFTIGVIDVNDLAKGTFSFRVLQSLE